MSPAGEGCGCRGVLRLGAWGGVDTPGDCEAGLDGSRVGGRKGRERCECASLLAGCQAPGLAQPPGLQAFCLGSLLAVALVHGWFFPSNATITP